MFDFAWSEIALIGVVALIAIGPKDMPVAIKAISDTIKKLRRMAGEFQGHVDEMLREADLGDVKSSFNELRQLNPKAMVQRAIDPDGTVRSAFSDPFRDHPVTPVMTKLDQVHVAERPTTAIPMPAPDAPAPAFVPPVFVPPEAADRTQPALAAAPAFIPPACVPANAMAANLTRPAYRAPTRTAAAPAPTGPQTPDAPAPTPRAGAES